MPESLTALRREPVIMHESDKQRLALSRLLPAYTCKVRDLNTAIITLLKLIIMGFIKKNIYIKNNNSNQISSIFCCVVGRGRMDCVGLSKHACYFDLFMCSSTKCKRAES